MIADSFLASDAVLALAADIAGGLRVDEAAIAARVERELPFMASETFLMEGTLRGGDRQDLHERIRRFSLQAYAAVSAGGANPLLDLIAAEPEFRLSRQELEELLDPVAFTGRSEQQVEEFLDDHLAPALARFEPTPLEEPRV